jgi:hypothetical protein
MQPGIRSVNRLTANKVITSNIVLATLGLAVPTGPGARHHVKWWIPFTEAAGVAGAKFQLITPAAITSFLLTVAVFNPATNTINGSAVQTASAAFTTPAAAAQNWWAVFEAEVVNGVNSGVLDLQVAQSVSDPNALTFIAGSWVEDVVF